MSGPLKGMGLVEPLPTTAKHLAIARSLSTIQNNAVHIQVMNTGPLPIQLYRGTKLATFTPRDHVFVLEEESAVNACSDQPLPHFDCGNLTSAEQNDLRALLYKYRHLFVEHAQDLGHTSRVTHSIHTTGVTIKQPNRRLPIALKPVVASEVQKMLDKNIVRPSSSAWSSPVVLVKKKTVTGGFVWISAV